jgi:hypothetical protein
VRRVADERQRTRGARHAVGGVDVPLEHDRDAMQRPAYLTVLALAVELAGDLSRVGVHLEHRVDLRTLLVELRDAVEIHVHDVDRPHSTGHHRGLEPGDRHLLDGHRRRGHRSRFAR